MKKRSPTTSIPTRKPAFCQRCGTPTTRRSGFAWCVKCDEPVRDYTYDAIDSGYFSNSVGLANGGRRKLMAKTGID